MRPLLFIAALAAVLTAGAASGRMLEQGSDTIPTAYPAATARYQALLTPAQRRLPWLARFDGVTAPLHEIDFGDHVMLMGWSCKPHDCGDNQVIVLFARDGSRAVARIVIGGEANAAFVGAPDARERACMSRPHDGPTDSDHC